MLNQFETLDAQDEMSRFAQMSAEEHAEMQAWIDETRAQEETEIAA
jgi:hypothetical protein